MRLSHSTCTFVSVAKLLFGASRLYLGSRAILAIFGLPGYIGYIWTPGYIWASRLYLVFIGNIWASWLYLGVSAIFIVRRYQETAGRVQSGWGRSRVEAKARVGAWRAMGAHAGVPGWVVARTIEPATG